MLKKITLIFTAVVALFLYSISQNGQHSPETAYATYIGDRNFFIEVSKGNIAGHSLVNVAGNNYNLDPTEETIWDQGGNLVYLTADTTLYASSSSASDTNVLIAVVGLDDTYTEVTRLVTVTGQTQVALSGQMFRHFSATCIGTNKNVGDIYIAESDTLTGGVPDTASKIKSKMVAGNGITRNGFYTVPAGHTGYLIKLRHNSAEGDDLTLTPNIRFFGGVFLPLVEWYVFEMFPEFDMSTSGITFPEKMDLEYRGSSTNNSRVGAMADILLVEDGF